MPGEAGNLPRGGPVPCPAPARLPPPPPPGGAGRVTRRARDSAGRVSPARRGKPGRTVAPPGRPGNRRPGTWAQPGTAVPGTAVPWPANVAWRRVPGSGYRSGRRCSAGMSLKTYVNAGTLGFARGVVNPSLMWGWHFG